jgi:hypothetical protein
MFVLEIERVARLDAAVNSTPLSFTTGESTVCQTFCQGLQSNYVHKVPAEINEWLTF